MKNYDTAADVVAKAMRGLDRTPAAEAGMSIEQVGKFLRGSFDPAMARRMAEALELDADALASYPKAWPKLKLPAEVTQFVLPFGDESVNAWQLMAGAFHLVIDSGLNPGDLAARLNPKNRIHLLITHPHPDHVGGISGVRDRTEELLGAVGVAGARILNPGERLSIGPFDIEVHRLSGHHPDALGYHIRTSGWQVFAPGDAIFAGSIGGCRGPNAYRRARRSILAAISDLPPDVIILPGHGPATTLATELVRNPFLARWTGGSAPRS